MRTKHPKAQGVFCRQKKQTKSFFAIKNAPKSAIIPLLSYDCTTHQPKTTLLNTQILHNTPHNISHKIPHKTQQKNITNYNKIYRIIHNAESRTNISNKTPHKINRYLSWLCGGNIELPVCRFHYDIIIIFGLLIVQTYCRRRYFFFHISQTV